MFFFSPNEVMQQIYEEILLLVMPIYSYYVPFMFNDCDISN